MARLLTAGFLVFVVTFVALELSINGVWQTDHSTSFVQLDYSIWHDHSFALTSATKIPPWSVDDFVHNGQNYSALAPGAAFLALPFAGLGFTLAGEYTAFGPVLSLTETFVVLTASVAAYLVYALSCLYFRRSTSMLLGFAFGLSTTVWPMATYMFQSDVSAMFVLLAAYLAVRAIRASGPATTLAALSGLAAGAAFTVDYVNGIIFPVMLSFLIIRKRWHFAEMAKPAGAFILGAVPGLAMIGAYNYSIFGSPFITTEQAYLHSSSVFGSFSTSPVFGLSLDLFSPARGLFVYAPFLVLGVLGLIGALRNGAVRYEMAFYFTIFLAILLPYSMWSDPYGGLSFGPRFLVAAIPFLLLPAGFLVDKAAGWKSWIIGSFYVAGVLLNGTAAVVSAIPVTTGFGDFPFTSVIVPRFVAGDLDTSWAGTLPFPWLWAAGIVLCLGVVLPMVTVKVARGREWGALHSDTAPF